MTIDYSFRNIRTAVADHALCQAVRAAALRPEHDTLAALLHTTDPGALAAIDAKTPARPKSGPMILTMRAKAIRAALDASKVKAKPASPTPPRAPAGSSQNFKPAASAAHLPPAVVAPALTTAKLEALAVEVFGHGALPSLDSMGEAEKRAALAREFYMANLKVPGVTDDPALAAKNWWRPAKLTGAFITIAAYRQARVNAALALPSEKPRIITRAAFDKLSPVEQSQFCLAGGLLTDN